MTRIETKPGVGVVESRDGRTRDEYSTQTAADVSLRIRRALKGESFAAMARDSGITPASVRRYLNGAAPSVDFARWAVIRHGLSADFVLRGVGPVLREDQEREALRCARTADLMREVGRRLEHMERSARGDPVASR